MAQFSPKPEWLKVRAPGGDTYHHLKETFRKLDLHTVCEEARCPNVGECWREGTATVMLLGDVCTRGCRFCAVTTGDPRGAVDVREPEHVARAIARLSLQYVVMTMVNRDDLLDGGAEHVARTVRRLHALRPDLLIETLVGDFQGHMSGVDVVVDAGPDVFAHNVEVVRRITRAIRDVRSSYDQSLAVLRRAKERQRRLAAEAAESGAPAPRRLTKSSIMVGIGETDDEVLEALRDLRDAGVDIVTIGQYLRPSPKHAPVQRFVVPETFAAFERAALEMGFLYAASAPLVRSSYKAAEVFVRSLIDRTGAELGAGGDAAEAGARAGEGAARVEALLEERLAVARREAARLSAELDPDEPPSLGGLAAAGPPDERPRGLVPAASLVRR
ncbi:lipoyl synthase [Sorangium cellulosum]|uniref:Lipoyl synthase n=1 Tax=Sorangium cellulosum TaxID=56 RepID=A0A2L0EMZ6_SORCE|nr:lipoyl synthase [Sorangium cellulosum]AUX40681.1 lipoyl synthase [Sorangium cellulosum]